MRLSGIKGSVTVIMIFAVPIMVALLALLVDGGRLIVARTRLEVAADRAAIVGANVLADGLDEIAERNWDIHKAARDLKREFSGGIEQHRPEARDQYRSYENKRDSALTVIERVFGAMQDRASGMAVDTLLANAPHASAQVSFLETPAISDDADPDQNEDVRYTNVTGSVFYDPVDIEGESFPVLKYLVKESRGDGIVRVSAEETIRPMLIGGFVGRGMKIQALSTAQAFGGSIEEFARRETDSASEAEGMVDEGGFDALYRVAAVPSWRW